MSGGFFRGTSVEQDARFANKATALLQSMRFPPLYRQRVELSRVDVESIAGWVHSTVAELLGMEDDVVGALALSSLSQAKAARRPVDPRELEVTLTSFLGAKGARAFVQQLWQRLLDLSRPPPSAAAPPPPSQSPSTASAPSKRRSRFGPPPVPLPFLLRPRSRPSSAAKGAAVSPACQHCPRDASHRRR